MGESDNLERLNQMKASVSARDMKIWENVAHTVCLKKETEKLKDAIKRMKNELVEKKKENKMIEEQLAELTKTLDIQRSTLRASERSVVLQKSLNESLLQEAADFKKKYDEALALYNLEFEDYRSIHENASKSYQDLKKLKIELKRYQVEKMILDERVASLEESELQYEEIQRNIFYATMIKLAEYCILYRKNEEMKRLVQERKKEEQHLLKEHFRLGEEVKQKKKEEQSKPTVSEERRTDTPNNETSKDSDKLKKFLNEEYIPCSLTAIDSSQRTPKYNQDKSKVKILENKIIKPSLPPIKKTDFKIREKIQNIVESTKKQVSRNNSFRVNSFETKMTKLQNPQKRSESQIKFADSTNKTLPAKTVPQSIPKPNGPSMGSEGTTTIPATLTGSQIVCASQTKSQIPKSSAGTSQNPSSGKTQEMKTNSILKSSQEKKESVSKFFTPSGTKKKSVTFQNASELQGLNKFQLFSREQNPPSGIIKDMNIFPKPFAFKEDVLSKSGEKNKSVPPTVLPEAKVGEPHISFPSETAPTNFATYGGDTFDKKDASFDPPFNPVFGPEALSASQNLSPVGETPTFSFFASQNKSSNPFGL